MKNILCFGDSNTFGYIPDGSGRFDEHTRWTGRLQMQLKGKYHVIEEGLCGRTTVFQDVLRPGRRGVESISVAIESHNPIDQLIVMLGTNDCKTRYQASPQVIAKGLEKVIKIARQYGPEEMKILILSPIHLGIGVGEEGYDEEFDENSEFVSRELAREYKKLAKKYQCDFLDMAAIAKASKVDREHLDASGHKKIAEVLTGWIKEETIAKACG